MKKLFVSLFVMLSLLIGPLAHAAGIDCPEAGCAFETVKEKKHDNSKVAEAGHHCCCAPASFKTDAVAHVVLPTIAKKFTAIADDDMTSVVVGPLLEPPSQV